MPPERIRELRAELARIPGDGFKKRHIYVLRMKLAQAMQVAEMLAGAVYQTVYQATDNDQQVLEDFSVNFLEGLPRPLPPKGPNKCQK